ncbi:hypothetical protein [Nocardioides sp. LML1-1-1.1]|uniref:hypothetical protein n=1 Tax=Nocardioides sp. LML1-1-1.1 TaxID=3135248 RepID=UPI0034261644
MSTTPARPARLAALALVVPLLAGCGDDAGPDDPAPAGWPATRVEVELRGLAWASSEGTIHLGDGSTLDAGEELRSFVLARGGAYVVGAGDDTLRRVGPDGSDDLPARPDPQSLTVSPDGRYLALVDHTGRRDRFDTPLAEAVVVDLATGTEVLRSDAGMGDPGSDDLADLYEELEPAVVGVDERRAYVLTTADLRAVDLRTGSVDVLGDAGTILTDQPWYAGLHPELVPDSPDGAWAIRPRSGAAPTLVADAGTVVTTRLSAADLGVDPLAPGAGEISWTLDSWLDATTAVGTAVRTDPAGGAGEPVLITCQVPSGACAAVPGTEDGALVPVGREGPGVLVPRPLEVP